MKQQWIRKKIVKIDVHGEDVQEAERLFDILMGETVEPQKRCYSKSGEKKDV